MDTASTEQTNLFVEGYLKLYDDIEKDGASAMADVQSSLTNLTFAPNLIRHWQYWITLDTVLKVRKNVNCRLTLAIIK